MGCYFLITRKKKTRIIIRKKTLPNEMTGKATYKNNKKLIIKKIPSDVFFGFSLLIFSIIFRLLPETMIYITPPTPPIIQINDTTILPKPSIKHLNSHLI
jgi:hypothetical protein